ncbi:DUF4836 family protein [Faecalibacter sp. LW9]|uniref:DUF4836 family protein n=1 Tax=Faecalibacter sp. LW9 TaxID=3103144 RepID=UPI002AFDF718|nr:DUF4836 family protein [Faecalibacter sp. LW9]
MKIIVYITCLLLCTLQFISCSKGKNYVEIIPSDADFVIQLNPKTIAEKGNFKELEKYQMAQFLTREVKNQDPALAKLFDQIRQSPTSFGLDIISPLYIFGTQFQNKVIVTLSVNMDNKSDFEEQLKIIYQGVYKKEISFKSEHGYTTIDGIKKPFMMWDKHKFLFVAGEYGTNDKTLNEYFTKLNAAQIPLQENNSFKDFLKNSQDINLWCTGNFVKYFNREIQTAQTNLDLSKSSWVTYLSFNNGNISFTHKFHPDVDSKVKLEKRPMWKNRINTEFYKYFPAESFMNVSFGLYPNNLRTLTYHNDFINDLIETYQIDLDLLKQSFDGDLLYSVFDFEAAQSYSINDYFNQKETFHQTVIIPQFIIAGKMKNHLFYDHLIDKLGKNLIQSGNHYQLKISGNHGVYMTLKNDILFITNNLIQLNNFSLNRVAKNNFVTSPYSNNANNPMFGYMNLNLEDYTPEVQHYFLKKIPISHYPSVQLALQNLKEVNFKTTDEYTKIGSIILKKQSPNALEFVLHFLDDFYQEFTNTNSYSRESN